MTDDLDKSGRGFQKARTYLGPTLGWVDERVQPSTSITIAGTYTVQPGDSLLLVDTTSPVTINLPDVRNWISQVASQPATGFARVITIKDFGGNADSASIAVNPFGTQTIDKVNAPIFITSVHGVFGLIPLVDLSGWTVVTGPGGPPPPPPSILSSPTAVATGLFTATLHVTADTNGGTLFWVVTTSSMPPTSTQIRAGQDNTGAPAVASGSQVVGAVGVQTASATGLSPPTNYTAHFVQIIGGTSSNVVSSATFNTVFTTFGTAADRINVLHPALADGTNTGPKPFGVSMDLPANLINQWIPGGSSTVPNNFVTFGAMTTAPDGTNTAQKIVEAATNQTHSVVAGMVMNNNLTWQFVRLRLQVVVKQAERSRIVLAFQDTSFSNATPTTAFPGPNGTKAIFDLNAGTVALANTGFGGINLFPVSESITSLGSGWYKCTIDSIAGGFARVVNNAPILAFMYLDAGTGGGAENSSYAGNGTSGIFAWKANCLPPVAFDINNQAFYDDFLNYSTIDVNNTKTTGFNWYVEQDNMFTAGPFHLTQTTDYDVTGSIISFHVPDIHRSGNWMASVVTDGTAQGFIGQSFGLPALFEARAFWDAPPGAFSGPNWPAWWTSAVEGMFAPTGGSYPLVNTFERDFFELQNVGFPPSNIPSYNTHELDVGPSPPSQTFAAAPSNVTPNFQAFHTYGTLVIPQATGTPAFGTGQRNILPNTAFTGAVPGTPGTLPSRMQFTNFAGGTLPPGISSQVVSVSGGAFQLRIFGTVGGSGSFAMGFEFNSGPHNNAGGTVAPGQIWTGSVYLRRTAGTDIGGGLLTIGQYSAADGVFGISSSQVFQGLQDKTVQTRFSVTGSIQGSGTARISLGVSWVVNTGQVIDATYEAFQPQLELSAMPTPFQASTGADTIGVVGVTVANAEPFFGKELTFFDGNHCNDFIRSSLTMLPQIGSIPSNFMLGGDTLHYPLIMAASGSIWPTHYDWVSVFTR